MPLTYLRNSKEIEVKIISRERFTSHISKLAKNLIGFKSRSDSFEIKPGNLSE